VVVPPAPAPSAPAEVGASTGASAGLDALSLIKRPTAVPLLSMEQYEDEERPLAELIYDAGCNEDCVWNRVRPVCPSVCLSICSSVCLPAAFVHLHVSPVERSASGPACQHFCLPSKPTLLGTEPSRLIELALLQSRPASGPSHVSVCLSVCHIPPGLHSNARGAVVETCGGTQAPCGVRQG
jgi:hypothetical protein